MTLSFDSSTDYSLLEVFFSEEQYSCCSGYMVWDMGNSRQIAANSVAKSSVHKVMMLRYEILLQLRYPK